MEKREVMSLLALMQANWAHVEVSDLTTAVWCEHLRDVPPASGLSVANQLIKDNDHFPNVHEFREAWRAHRRKERDWHSAPALEPAYQPSTKDVGLAGIALARVALADAKPIQVRREQRQPPKERERRDTV